jgi:hypothetical protein
MELTSPRAITLDLNDPQAVTVSALLPLVDVAKLKVLLNGIDILDELGIAAADVFPTEDACLCSQPGERLIQIEAGCGDGRLMDVDIRNLRVDGLDQGLAIDAFEGVGTEPWVVLLHSKLGCAALAGGLPGAWTRAADRMRIGNRVPESLGSG